MQCAHTLYQRTLCSYTVLQVINPLPPPASSPQPSSPQPPHSSHQPPSHLTTLLYCQVIKQVNGNPSTKSETRGWDLLATASVHFPPSCTLLSYALTFVAARTTQQGPVGGLALFVMRQVQYYILFTITRCIILCTGNYMVFVMRQVQYFKPHTLYTI
jgi:hypothetical protein